MPLSWNEIKDRAIHFSKEWENETSEDMNMTEPHFFWSVIYKVPFLFRLAFNNAPQLARAKIIIAHQGKNMLVS
jgi:hypothetical protein